MVVKACLLFLLMDLATVFCAEEDPCFANKPLGKMNIRGTMCPVSGEKNPNCDRLIDGGWYKAVYKGIPMDMTTTCINPGSCGTEFPIWLNGKLPAVSEGIVQRQACVRGLFGGDCCIRQYDISVKNCSTYNVYNLPYTEACDDAYCFGDHACDIPVTKPASSVLMSSTSPPASSQTSQENIKDPCVANKPLGKMDIRGTMCSVSGKVNCDRLIDGGWYKTVYKGIPADMPTTCVNPDSCGTGFPIWLNGKLPAVSEGIVQRQACVRGLFGGDCCIRQYNISVKNCSTYNVYNLPYTEACDEAYCFGDHDCDVPVTKSTSSLLISSTGPATASPTSQGGNKDDVTSESLHCQHGADIAVTVAVCLCSAVVGSLITFLLMYRCDGTHRGKVLFNNPQEKTGEPFCYSVFSSKDESAGGRTKFPVEGFTSSRA